MVIEWKEREHDAVDALAIEDEACMDALRDCGLKKFFLTPYLRAQPELLRFIIDARDVKDQVFRLRDQTLELDVSDVYFITGLSQRGARPILTGSRPSGEKMREVVDKICPGAQFGPKVDIATVPDLVLRVILFTITCTAGVQAPHEASKNHLLLAAECLSPTLFDWASAVTLNIKRQLTKCKHGGNKQFGYGSIIVSFFLERLPIFRIQSGIVADLVPREPRMARWAALMPRGGGGQQMVWRPEFFIWLRDQLIAVNDWPYAGTDFTGDPDLALPEGEDWDEELGKNSLCFLNFFMYFNVFGNTCVSLTMAICVCRCRSRATCWYISHRP